MAAFWKMTCSRPGTAPVPRQNATFSGAPRRAQPGPARSAPPGWPVLSVPREPPGRPRRRDTSRRPSPRYVQQRVQRALGIRQKTDIEREAFADLVGVEIDTDDFRPRCEDPFSEGNTSGNRYVPTTRTTSAWAVIFRLAKPHMWLSKPPYKGSLAGKLGSEKSAPNTVAPTACAKRCSSASAPEKAMPSPTMNRGFRAASSIPATCRSLAGPVSRAYPESSSERSSRCTPRRAHPSAAKRTPAPWEAWPPS